MMQPQITSEQLRELLKKGAPKPPKAPGAKKSGGGNRSTNHTKLVNAVDHLLDVLQIFHWKNNTGAAYHGTRFVQYGKPGASDLIAVINGWFVGFECKTGKGELTDLQKEFRRNILASGGFYFEVRASAEVAEHVRTIRAMRPPPKEPVNERT